MKFNVTEIEFDFDDDYANGFDLTFDEEIELRDLTLGVWHTEGKDAEGDLWNKVEAYIGVPLASLEYCKNRPHKLTSFK